AAAPASGPDPLQLRSPVVDLPRARSGRFYEHTLDAWGGAPPRSFERVSGELPEGLALESDGRIHGTTSGGARAFRFVVQAKDSATPPKPAQQAYELRVESAESASARAAPGPASMTGWIPSLPPQSSEEATEPPEGAVVVYKLSADNLDKIAP